MENINRKNRDTRTFTRLLSSRIFFFNCVFPISMKLLGKKISIILKETFRDFVSTAPLTVGV